MLPARLRHPLPALVAVTAALAAGLVWWLGDDGAGEPAPVAADPPPAEMSPRLGGMTTAFDDGPRAFNLSARNLGLDDSMLFAVGDDVFELFFTEAQGLGPGYNGTGCMSCHVNNGRGAIPDGDGVVVDPGPVVKLSIGTDDLGRPVPHPTWGLQLQTDGPAAEADLGVAWETITGTYPDGSPYELRRPVWSVTGAEDDDLSFSVRTAPHLAGVGLLGAIDPDDVLALADPDDADGDGISGRPQWVTGPDGERRLGRFGWRAAQPTVLDQTAGAFAEDMGISTDLALAPGDDRVELDRADLDSATFYTETLAVPAMRDTDDPDVRAGAAWFTEVGCAGCHTPGYRTAVVEISALSDQEIWPYTDLLLHDMGPELADDRPELEASGTEWRTAPLWGLGLHDVVNANTGLLHDGRARTPEEAILWHGGEGEAARIGFTELDAEARAQLLAFLDAL